EMASRHHPHASVPRNVWVDCDTGLDISTWQISERTPWPAEADVLMVAEFSHSCARRLPVQLIDDLLQIGADMGRKDFHGSWIDTTAVERDIEIGGPLDQADHATQPCVIGNAEEHILMAVAPRMLQGFGIDPVESGGELRHLFPAEKILDDGVAVFPVMRDVVAGHGVFRKSAVWSLLQSCRFSGHAGADWAGSEVLRPNCPSRTSSSGSAPGIAGCPTPLSSLATGRLADCEIQEIGPFLDLHQLQPRGMDVIGNIHEGGRIGG